MDASFANNKDLSSQIGYVLVLADAIKKANMNFTIEEFIYLKTAVLTFR